MFDLVSSPLNAIRKSFLSKPAPEPNFPATVFVNGRAAWPEAAAAHTLTRARHKFASLENPLDNMAADPLASTWLMDLPER